MQDVASSLSHGRAEQAGALFVNDLEIGHELAREMAHGRLRHHDAKSVGQSQRNLWRLSVFEVTV